MKNRKMKLTALPILIGLAVVLCVLILLLDAPEPAEDVPTTVATEPTADPYVNAKTPMERLTVFAELNGLSLEKDWTPELLTRLEKNPDLEEFVTNYPLLKGTREEADLSDMIGTGEVPRLYQWDLRWGYSWYGEGDMAFTGCAPTCLSMVCLYYFQDAKYTPRYVADFAMGCGYYETGYGSKWTLMWEGAGRLGLNSYTIPPNADSIMMELEKGNLVILSVGPGIFTEGGHYLLLTGVQDGLAVMHDPYSRTNSEKLWDVSTFRDQIENVWVYEPVN